MIYRKVTSVRQMDTIDPESSWIIEFTKAEGYPDAHGFPRSAPGWRAAEYDIDPSDMDTLLEIVLCEPYMNLHHSDPTFIRNTDQKTAREAHLNRVAEVRKLVVHDDHLNLLEPLRNSCTPTAAEHAERVRAVAEYRAGNNVPSVQLGRRINT